MMTAGVAAPTRAYGVPYSRDAAAMPDSEAIMNLLLEALPEEAPVLEELHALGAVTGAVIGTLAPEHRAEMVDLFCDTLRKHVARELN